MNEIIKIENDKNHIAKHIFTKIVNEKEYTITWFYRKERINIPTIGSPDDFSLQFDQHINSWKNLIKPGSIAIDIGAAHLDTSIWMAVLVGEKGKVLAFEPFPDLQETVELHLKYNPELNIQFSDKAIMEKEGEFDFLYELNNTNGGPSFLTSYLPQIYSNPIKLKGIRLDKYLNDNNIDIKNISFIKLDTEGYDCVIIDSISKIIHEIKPIIQIENFPGTRNYIKNILDIYGYYAIDSISLEKCNVLTHNPLDQDFILIPN